MSWWPKIVIALIVIIILIAVAWYLYARLTGRTSHWKCGPLDGIPQDQLLAHGPMVEVPGDDWKAYPPLPIVPNGRGYAGTKYGIPWGISYATDFNYQPSFIAQMRLALPEGQRKYWQFYEQQTLNPRM